MASFLHPEIELDVHSSIIDCNWYYGCLFSPKKKCDIDAMLSADNVHPIAEGDRTEHPIAHKYFSFEQGLSEGSNNGKDSVDEEATCLASMFRVLDEDGDGRVSVDEILRFLKRLSFEMPKDEVESVVRSVSSSGSEFLTAMEFDEFYRMIFSDKEEEVDNGNVEEKAICEAFGVFDQNGDGLISAMELADVLSRLGFVEGRDVNCCQSMIESVDYNGDGFVDLHEFKHLMTRNSTSLPYPCLHCVPAVN